MKKATAAAPPATIAPATLFAKAAPVNSGEVAVLPCAPVPLTCSAVVVGGAAHVEAAHVGAAHVGIVVVTEELPVGFSAEELIQVVTGSASQFS
jgi:hypothetical protein